MKLGREEREEEENSRVFYCQNQVKREKAREALYGDDDGKYNEISQIHNIK